MVLRFDPALDPILRIALGGPDELTISRRLADRKLKEAFETILGVASARIKGGLEEEIQVEVDQERLAALGIPLQWVRQDQRSLRPPRTPRGAEGIRAELGGV